jgi:hypothetical protein
MVTEADRNSYRNLDLNLAAAKLTALSHQMYVLPKMAPLLDIARIIIQHVRQGKFE